MPASKSAYNTSMLQFSAVSPNQHGVMLNGKLTCIYIVLFYFWSTDHSKCFTTLNHSQTRVQRADLLLRSGAALLSKTPHDISMLSHLYRH